MDGADTSVHYVFIRHRSIPFPLPISWPTTFVRTSSTPPITPTDEEARVVERVRNFQTRRIPFYTHLKALEITGLLPEGYPTTGNDNSDDEDDGAYFVKNTGPPTQTVDQTTAALNQPTGADRQATASTSPPKKPPTKMVHLSKAEKNARRQALIAAQLLPARPTPQAATTAAAVAPSTATTSGASAVPSTSTVAPTIPPTLPGALEIAATHAKLCDGQAQLAGVINLEDDE